ncbi:uncharacterized protein K452DRAFT_81315 [Aplosporella prunicola CBS 121167]|uniref:Uncharacterized protein n=1 Tax=Aplosporella prunicola CBS 121167 TaxID=1176127 RepID=A0A6A6B7B9_9PEZI|nr:uncharacterized protein K452DRAFT_81315 [Aplosporella prunicola CBS 121167]KAF2139135.1 hypothetical protein K452DRAFT_81315 [Aplosporella prunicola CBS 121167]
MMEKKGSVLIRQRQPPRRHTCAVGQVNGLQVSRRHRALECSGSSVGIEDTGSCFSSRAGGRSRWKRDMAALKRTGIGDYWDSWRQERSCHGRMAEWVASVAQNVIGM